MLLLFIRENKFSAFCFAVAVFIFFLFSFVWPPNQFVGISCTHIILFFAHFSFIVATDADADDDDAAVICVVCTADVAIPSDFSTWKWDVTVQSAPESFIWKRKIR